MRTALKMLAVVLALAATVQADTNVLSLDFHTRLLAEGLGTLTNWGEVSLSVIQSNDTTVTLQSGDLTEISITNTVVIGAGEESSLFDLRVLRDTIPDGLQTVSISANAAGFTAVTSLVEVADNGGQTPRVQFSFPSRVDRYDPDLSNTNVQAPVENNFSGCTLSADSTELLVVCKQRWRKEYIQVFDTNAVYARIISFVFPDFDDVEGICLVDPAANLYALVDETSDEIAVLTIATNTTELSKAGAEILQFDLPYGKDSNKSIEGVSYDPLNDVFYIVQEKLPEDIGLGVGIYRVRGTGSNTVTEILFDAKQVFEGLATDFSDITYDPYSGRLFILSDEAARVFECDLAGRIVASLPLTATQPEGIVLSPDGASMHIAGEPNEVFRYRLSAEHSGPEGVEVHLPVALTRPATGIVSVAYSISSDSAEPGVDYAPETGLVTFAAGSTTGAVSLSILNDGDIEPAEVLYIRLTNAVGADLACDSVCEYPIDGDAVNLVVRSPHGAGSPAIGTNVLIYLDELNCSILESPVALGPGSRAVCTGWTGSNSVPAGGSGTSTPSFVLTNDSWISWHWQTEYWLGAVADGGGTVSGGNLWLSPGVNAWVYAHTNRYYEFGGWSGDVHGADTNNTAILLTMDGPRNVTGHFPPLLAPLGTPQWWLALHYGHTNDFANVEIGDTDADGFLAWQEYIADTVPTNRLSFPRFSQVRTSPDGFIVEWPGSAERVYDLYCRTNMLEGAWRLLGSNVPGSVLPATSYSDSWRTNRNVYYRLKVRVP